MVYYFDSSAILKLVLNETESQALVNWMVQQGKGPEPVFYSSDLAKTEVLIACRRLEIDQKIAEQVLGNFQLLTIPTARFRAAGELGNISLRSLDALHLSSAMSLGSELTAIVTYDKRMLSRCHELELATQIIGEN